jgi:superfamily II DNA helicase RecQ
MVKVVGYPMFRDRKYVPISDLDSSKRLELNDKLHYSMANRQIKFLSVRLDSNMESDELALNEFLRGRTTQKIAPALIQGTPPYWSIYVEWRESQPAATRTTRETLFVEDPSELDSDELVLYEKLREWRTRAAAQMNVPEYVVFHNSHLATIARTKPRNEDELMRIYGIKHRKAQTHGAAVIRIVTEHTSRSG